MKYRFIISNAARCAICCLKMITAARLTGVSPPLSRNRSIYVSGTPARRYIEHSKERRSSYHQLGRRRSSDFIDSAFMSLFIYSTREENREPGLRIYKVTRARAYALLLSNILRRSGTMCCAEGGPPPSVVVV